MKVKPGQFWFKSGESYHLLEIKQVNYIDSDTIETVCNLWSRYSLGRYVRAKDNHWVIAYKHEFKNWHLLDFEVY